MATTMVRDVDKLVAVPDDQLRRQGKDYLVSVLRGSRYEFSQHLMKVPLQEKHNINALFNGLLQELLKQKPKDPIQFMIDTITIGPEEAVQVVPNP